MKPKFDYSRERQYNINRWFEKFKEAGILTQDDYHEYCKWVSGRTLGDVMPWVFAKKNPLREDS